MAVLNFTLQWNKRFQEKIFWYPRIFTEYLTYPEGTPLLKLCIPTDVSFMHLSCRTAVSCGCMDNSPFKWKANLRLDSTRVLQRESERKWMRVILSHYENLYIMSSNSETAVPCCSHYFLSPYVLPTVAQALSSF